MPQARYFEISAVYLPCWVKCNRKGAKQRKESAKKMPFNHREHREDGGAELSPDVFNWFKPIGVLPVVPLNLDFLLRVFFALLCGFAVAFDRATLSGTVAKVMHRKVPLAL